MVIQPGWGAEQPANLQHEELSAGLHAITLVVVDDEGETSAPAHAILYVADDVYNINIPWVRK